MKTLISNKRMINTFIILITYTFIIFIILNITDIIVSRTVIEIILVIWIFDTFCYIGGKMIGGKKLIPSISTGKTYSGLIIGIFSTLILMLIYQLITNQLIFRSMLFTGIIILLAFLGDTFASYVKRASAIKDSGTIMPGHGGLLDRLDSFIGVFFILSLMYLLA